MADWDYAPTLPILLLTHIMPLIVDHGVRTMGQVTIYLDDESEKRVKAAAKKAGIPVSRWLANLVKDNAHTVWPGSIAALAGAWGDFPDLADLREDESNESQRERL